MARQVDLKTALLPIIILLIAIGGYLLSDQFHDYLTLSYLKSHLDDLKMQVTLNHLLAVAIFSIGYTVAAIFSVPGLTLISVLAGGLFGFWEGTAIVSFASTTGATVTFLMSRYFLKDFLISKFDNQIRKMHRKIDKDCGFHLLTLRLVPVAPFTLVNIFMGITNLSLVTFVLVSQIGMLAPTMIYVNAGLQLSQITSVYEIFTWPVIFAFTGLSIIPQILRFKFRSDKVSPNSRADRRWAMRHAQ